MLLVFLLAPAAVGPADARQPARWSRANASPAGKLPTDVAVDGSTVWVVSGRDNRVVALDARDAEQAPEVHATGSSPLRLAVGQGSVWTANAGDDTVTRLDPLHARQRARDQGRRRGRRRRRQRRWHVGDATAGGHRDAHRPVSNRVLGQPVRTGSFPTALAVGAGYVWVVNSGDGTVARIDPRENVVIGRRIAVGRDPQDIAVGHGSVWVANRGDGTVTRLSADDGRRQGAPIKVGGSPARSPSRATPCSCSTRCAATCGRSRRGPGELDHVSRVGGFPTSLAVGAGSAWVVDARSGSVTRLSER